MSSASEMPPRVSGLPFLGSLPKLAWQQLEFLEQAHRELGGLFEVDLGLTKVVFVAAPDLAEHVLIRSAADYDKSGDFWDTLRDMLGSGLPVSGGDLWRRQRRLMTPEFHTRRIAEFRSTICETIAEQLDALPQQSQPIDVEAWSHHLLATLTIRVLLGSKLALARVERLRPAMSTMFDYALLGLIHRRLPSWLTHRGRQRFLDARRIVDEDIMSIVAERRASYSKSDLLGLLIETTDEEGRMDDRQLRDEIVALYIGGYETTGSTLAWMLWLLAERPNLLQRLKAELSAAPESDPTDSRLLDACIRESLRLYPPGPLIPRRAARDTTLGSRRIPAGAHVMVSPWLIHRDPGQWPRPLEFDPNRFLDPEAARNRHRLAWCPFGAGQRTCIGKELAMVELRNALTMIVRRFSIQSVPTQRPRPKLSTTLQSRSGIFLRLEPL